MKLYLLILTLPLFFGYSYAFTEEDKERDVIVLRGNVPIFGEILDSTDPDYVTIRRDNGRIRRYSRRNISAIVSESTYYSMYADPPRVKPGFMLDVFSGPSLSAGHGFGYGVQAGYLLPSGIMVGIYAHHNTGLSRETDFATFIFHERTQLTTAAFVTGYYFLYQRFSLMAYFSIGGTMLDSSVEYRYNTPSLPNEKDTFRAFKLAIPVGIAADYLVYRRKVSLGLNLQRGIQIGVVDPIDQWTLYEESDSNYLSLFFLIRYRF